LLLLERLGNRALAVLAIILLLQLPGLVELTRRLAEAGHVPAPDQATALMGRLYPVLSGGDLPAVMWMNLTEGRIASLVWNWEQMRYTQILGLFVAGLLLGRSRVLEDPTRMVALARRVLGASLAGAGLMVAGRLALGRAGLGEAAEEQARAVLRSYGHLALTLVWAGAFVLLYQRSRTRRLLRLFAPAGRMSLTCYMAQGIAGATLFHGFGVGLYRWLGPLGSLGVGAGLLVAQLILAHMWMRHFHSGPLEWLWRGATRGDFSVPIRLARTSS
jgi:uncharacterized protein